MALKLALVGLLVVAVCGCALRLPHLGVALERMRDEVRHIDCGDGAPARLIVDRRCQDGICGVTCAPNRWP